MEIAPFIILLSVFLVAALYSSVGHGGASGYLAVMALMAVAPEITRRVISAFARPGVSAAASQDAGRLTDLTPREHEVLVLLAAGATNAEIAAELFLGETTVKTHVSRVLTKMHARDRAQLVVVAYESGLITPGA